MANIDEEFAKVIEAINQARFEMRRRFDALDRQVKLMESRLALLERKRP